MITLAEAKLHLRVEQDFTEEDGLIESLISAAVLSLEHNTGRALRDRAETLVLDSWPAEVSFPWWPVRAVNSIKYIDDEGAEQLVAQHMLDVRSIPAVVTPYPAASWPPVPRMPQAIRIEVQVGLEVLPEDLKRAALLLVGNLYSNRESTVIGTIVAELPMAVDYLLQPYRLLRVG